MNVGLAPFSLESLPRLPRAAPAWTRATARARALFPLELTTSLRGLGPVTVRPRRLFFFGSTETTGPSFVFELGGQRCRLTFEPWTALRLLAAVLGTPSPSSLRSLGRAERGMLAAVVATFLDATPTPGSARIGLEDEGAIDSEEIVSLELAIVTPDFGGSARLDLPAAILPTNVGVPNLKLPLPPPVVPLALAHTTLPAAAFAVAAVGDAVVFEGTSALAIDTPWPIEIRLGDYRLPGLVFPDGTLRTQGSLGRSEKEISMTTNSSEPSTGDSLSSEAQRALAAAPVEIVAELGRITLRGDELVGLIEGGVLALGPRRPAQVQLRVGERLWAHGELVAVDNELAVRIVELVR